MQVTREELAWAAGFFDGEGCIYFGGSGRRNGGGTVHVTVTNTHHATLVWFQTHFGGRIGPQSTAPHCRPAWRWSLSGLQARLWLSLIVPWLHEKAAQADLARSIPRFSRGNRALTMEECWERSLQIAELGRLKRTPS